MNVLDHITALVDAGQRGAETEIHVSEETVLGIVCPHGDRARVSFRNLDINIGERRIKGARVGLSDKTVASLEISRAPSSEKDHELFMRRISETRCVGGQDNNRTFVTIAKQPDAGPDIKSITDAISPRCEQNNSLAIGLLNLIDRFLQCSGVVAAGWSNVNRLGIFQPPCVNRGGPGWSRGGEAQQNRNKKS